MTEVDQSALALRATNTEAGNPEAGVTRLNGKSPDAVLAEITTHWRNSATPWQWRA
ncbi:hypothetical protein KCP73_12515 [Salmonella enterica subsp. enterica]|nr:hypothetical protein KCP73_12515 [Salmonella enterica subsp. enterica]